MWSSTCQQKEEKAMPTYTQGTVTPAMNRIGREVKVRRSWNQQSEEEAAPAYPQGIPTPAIDQQDVTEKW